MSCGIYCIENKINHKKYVGQSIDIKSRWTQHRHTSSLVRDTFLYRAMVLYDMIFVNPIIRQTVRQLFHDRFIVLDYSVNLICVEVGIDSSKEAGKLLISIIAAVAEMERENIRVQTMAGREQKAREGKWNGGFAPYGYRMENGELVIAEDEVEIIQMIFD